MNCPVCKDTALLMTERQNTEIDYCPDCRGIWLERGKLDKIIERSTQETSASAPRPGQPVPPTQWGQNAHGHENEHHGYKKKSFWKEIFD